MRSIRTMLEQAPSCQRPQLASIQADAVIHMASSSSLTKEERASLSAIACQTGFPDAILQRVLTSFVPKRGSRRTQQQFEQFIHFLTAGDWEILLDVKTSLSVARVTVFLRLQRLGLRLPKEHTIKLMCSLCLFVTAKGRVEAIPLDERKARLKEFKSEWTKLMATTPDPAHYLEVLPPCAEFMQTYSELARLAYRPGETPVACKIDVEHLYDFGRAASCRAMTVQPVVGQASQQLVHAEGAGQGSMSMTDVMRMFMMQQQTMMDMLMGRAGQSQGAFAQGREQSIPGLQIFGGASQGDQGGQSVVRPGDALQRGGRFQVPSLEDIVAQSQQTPPVDATQFSSLRISHEAMPAQAGPADKATVLDTGAAQDAGASVALPAIEDGAVGGDTEEGTPANPRKRQCVADVMATLKSKAEGGSTGEHATCRRGRPPKGSSRVAKKAKAKAAPKAKAKATAKCKAAAKAESAKAAAAMGTDHKHGAPSFSMEWSRNQIMLRTGIKGKGQSAAVSLDKFDNIDAACAYARKWVASEKKKRGFV